MLDKDKCKKMLESGIPVKEVARFFNVKRGTIWSYNKKIWHIALRPKTIPTAKIKIPTKKTIRICDQCNKVYDVYKSTQSALLKIYGKRKHTFCSRKCQAKFYTKPDSERTLKGIRRGSGWWRAKRQVMKEVPYCQECGGDKNLVVHHIVPYHLTKDNSRENLSRLCASCHRKIEIVTKGILLKILPPEDVKYVVRGKLEMGRSIYG